MFRRSIVLSAQRLIPSSFSKLNIHSSSQIVLCSVFDKNLPLPNVPTPVKKLFVHDTDILLEQLTKAKTLERVLELTSTHLEVMNSKHIVACFNSVHSFIKVQGAESPTLTEDEIFQSLCARMMKVIRNLEPADVLSIYKTLAALGVRNNTFVMQSVLKMLGAHLNNMNLGELTFLSFLLSKQRPNSLVDGLRLALPLVLQVQIDQQLDSDNMSEIVTCLRVASKSRLKPATIEKIIAAVLNKASSITPELAVTIIYSLFNLQVPVDGYKELIHVSFNLLAKEAEYLDKKQILVVMRQCHAQKFYHHAFFNAVVKTAISEKWDFETCSELANHLNILQVSYSELVDYLSELTCVESEALINNPRLLPLNFIEYFTATGHKPINSEEASNVLLSCTEKIMKLYEQQPHLMLKFVSCLSLLGHFPQDLLSKMMNEDYLFKSWACSKQYGRSVEFERYLLSLLWSLDVYDQNQNFKIPVSILKKVNQSVQLRHAESNYPLTKFLENGLGGTQFIHNGIFTRDGHVVDHILAMRSGNYPVSFSSTPKTIFSEINPVMFVEDMELPEDAKIISIIVADESHYCQDPEVLKGWAEMKIKHLKKKSYSPVVINYKTWSNLPDREKIPYLMREIKEVTELDKPIQNSYVHDSF